MQLCGAGIEDYAKWSVEKKDVSSAKFYRVAWRRMAATTGFRTLYPALIPPGATHVNAVFTASHPSALEATATAGAVFSSYLVDFFVRSASVNDIWPSFVQSLPCPRSNSLLATVQEIYLRLNCLTSAYAPLWEELTGEEWTEDTPIRNAKERFHAQNDIDAIVASSLGVTVDELCLIYRTQFPVMRRYDREDYFDANGRKVPKEILKAHLNLREDGRLHREDRTWIHPQSGVTYTLEYPFTPVDREADLRRAYKEFNS